MAKLVGFTGDIGSGKTTAARLMHEFSNGEGLHLEFSDQVIKAGNAMITRLKSELDHIDRTILNTILLDLFQEEFSVDLDQEKVSNFDYTTLGNFMESSYNLITNSEGIDLKNKDLFRPLLQWLGYEFTQKYDNNFWSLSLESQIRRESQQRDLITVGGIRYDANALMIKGQNGRIANIIGRKSLSAAMDHDHASERGISEELIDYTIDNSGTLAQFAIKMYDLYRNYDSSPTG